MRSPSRVSIAIAVLLSAYVLMNGVLWMPNLTLVRLGLPPFVWPAHPSAFLDVLLALPWWIFLLWPVAVALLAVAAVRLFRGQRARYVFAAGAGIDVVFLILIKLEGAVAGRVFGVDPDYVVIAFLLTLAALTWRMEGAVR